MTRCADTASRGRAPMPTCAGSSGAWKIQACRRTRLSLATCGSSFGVVDRAATCREVARILEPQGWFACMWNHRDLDDPLQKEIESFIKASIHGIRLRHAAGRPDRDPCRKRAVRERALHRVSRPAPAAKAEWVRRLALARDAAAPGGRPLRGDRGGHCRNRRCALRGTVEVPCASARLGGTAEGAEA